MFGYRFGESERDRDDRITRTNSRIEREYSKLGHTYWCAMCDTENTSVTTPNFETREQHRSNREINFLRMQYRERNIILSLNEVRNESGGVQIDDNSTKESVGIDLVSRRYEIDDRFESQESIHEMRQNTSLFPCLPSQAEIKTVTKRFMQCLLSKKILDGVCAVCNRNF